MLTTDVRSSIHESGVAKFSSSDYLPNLVFPHVYEMTPPPFKFDNTDQLTSIISSILRLWLRFPTENDYLAQVTLLDIVTTNSPPSILFLDKIWEMYKTPFSTIFSNKWDIRRSKRKLVNALESFKERFALHPFAKKDSPSYKKLLSLSKLIYKWTQMTGVDSDTVEMVS